MAQPFTYSLRWIQDELSKRNLTIDQLTPEKLTLLFDESDLHSLSGSRTDKSQRITFLAQSGKMSAARYHLEVIEHQRVYIKNGSNHDLLNALMWLSLPLTRAVTFRQLMWAQSLRAPDTPHKRTHLEDRLTLFDESGVVIFSDRDDLLELIRKREWTTLFWTRRNETREHLKIWVTGHGLYEQLITPFVGLVGYGRLYHLSSSHFQMVGAEKLYLMDQLISRDLEGLSQHATLHLHAIPILGYPAWYQANSERSFYDQPRYFRGPYPLVNEHHD